MPYIVEYNMRAVNVLMMYIVVVLLMENMICKIYDESTLIFCKPKQ